jgi:hypothetical protein
MSNKSKLYGAVVTATLLILMYFALVGLAISMAQEQAGKAVTFTHAVFAELGTATW